MTEDGPDLTNIDPHGRTMVAEHVEVVRRLEGVEPTRLAEARRRIAAIEAYLAIAKPSARDTTGAASSLDLTRWQFERLVRAWRNHRDPTMIVHSSTGPKNRDYGIDERAKQIAQAAIRRAGLSAEISNVATLIEEACESEGIDAPSRPTIYNCILAERRSGQLRYDGSPCVFVGRTWFHLPIIGGAPASMPCAVLAVAMPERQVIGHAISTTPSAPPAVAKVVEVVLQRAEAGAQPRALLLDRLDLKTSISVLTNHELADIRPATTSLQRLLAKAFGDRIGPLQPVYRPSGALAKPTYTMGAHDRPLTAVEAQSIIEQAIVASNGERARISGYSIS